MHVHTRICVRAKDITATNKKADEERKAKKEVKERTETSVKAINMAIRAIGILIYCPASYYRKK